MKKSSKTSYGGYNKVKRRVQSLFRGFLFSFILTVPLALILSGAMAFTDFPEEYLSPAVLLTVALSIVLAAMVTTAPEENLGWVGGSLSGLFYMAVIMVVRWCLEGRIYMDKDIITLLLCGALLGTISGMGGLSLGQKIRGAKRNKRKKNPSAFPAKRSFATTKY